MGFDETWSIGKCCSQQEKCMTTKFRVSIAGMLMLALVGLFYVSDLSQAGDNDVKANVIKIAAAIKSGDSAGAKKMAAGAAKKAEEIADVMHMFRPRSKGGV